MSDLYLPKPGDLIVVALNGSYAIAELYSVTKSYSWRYVLINQGNIARLEAGDDPDVEIADGNWFPFHDRVLHLTDEAQLPYQSDRFFYQRWKELRDLSPTVSTTKLEQV